MTQSQKHPREISAVDVSTPVHPLATPLNTGLDYLNLLSISLNGHQQSDELVHDPKPSSKLKIFFTTIKATITTQQQKP